MQRGVLQVLVSAVQWISVIPEGFSAVYGGMSASWLLCLFVF
jgi:hypothetical protein